MKKRELIITAIVILVLAGFLVYRQLTPEAVPVVGESEPVAREEVLQDYNEQVQYLIPGGTHTVEFTLYVDKDGVIQDSSAEDLLDAEHQVRMEEFNATLLPMIKGKKLEDLEPIDMVGTSTLSTAAFNEALAQMQELL